MFRPLVRLAVLFAMLVVGYAAVSRFAGWRLRTRDSHPIALPKPAAAAALGMSVDGFERYVQADVCCIRRGRMWLYPVVELERWAGENAERLLSQAA